MTTHMIEVRLDALALMRLARERGLPRRQVDLGYLLHCQLGETFGEIAPRPFAILGREPLAGARELTVLAYATADATTLQQRALEGARPGSFAAIDWARFASKPMPNDWAPGRQLAFEVRACPVVRMGSQRDQHRKGAEVDVFLSECWRIGAETPVDREQVYRRWLSERLAARGVRALEVRVEALQLGPVTRRDHKPVRSSHVMRRPDVRFAGRLEITDGALFAQSLARGVGRHRAFGFGMLLVKPAP